MNPDPLDKPTAYNFGDTVSSVVRKAKYWPPLPTTANGVKSWK